MNEQEWRNCRSPHVWLRYARAFANGRKWRLFNTACCRQVWALLTDPRCREAVEAVEGAVDGRVARPALRASLAAASGAVLDSWTTARRVAQHGWVSREDKLTMLTRWGAAKAAQAAAAAWSLNGESAFQAWVAHRWTLVWSSPAGKRRKMASRLNFKWQQCAILRDILGNPFRPAPPLPPSVLAWNDGAPVKMATVIYDERAWDRLPILADALEDAGCDAADLLGHLRGPGPHVRGCWAVDLILNRR